MIQIYIKSIIIILRHTEKRGTFKIYYIMAKRLLCFSFCYLNYVVFYCMYV